MSDDESKMLENGLLIESIPEDLRTQQICINALVWGLKKYKTNDPKLQKEMCIRITNSFPKDILITGFVLGHLSDFV